LGVGKWSLNVEDCGKVMKNVDSMKHFFTKTVWEPLDRFGGNEYSDELLSFTTIDSHFLKDYAIAGGALRDYLIGETIKDIDIFCTSRQACDNIISALDDCSNNGSTPEVRKLSENDQLANYQVGKDWWQIIKGKYFRMQSDDLIRSFDFTICGAMMTGAGETAFLPTFFQDTLARHLRINTITYPLATLERMQKYCKRGYTACNGTLLEIAKSLQNLEIDLNSTTDISNQLRFYPDGTPRFVGID
jgi:hypothetical protein